MTIFVLGYEYSSSEDNDDIIFEVMTYTTDEYVAKRAVETYNKLEKIDEFFYNDMKNFYNQTEQMALTHSEQKILNNGMPKFNDDEKLYMHIPLEHRLKAIKRAKESWNNSKQVIKFKEIVQKEKLWKKALCQTYNRDAAFEKAKELFGDDMNLYNESIDMTKIPNAYRKLEEHKG